MNSPKKLVGLSVVVFINLALQFLFQWYIIVSFGSGWITDAFFGAMVIPQYVLLVLSGSLTLVLIPVLSQYSGDELLKEAWNFLQGIAILFGGLALILLLTSGWWIQFIFPAFEGETYVLALDIFRIQLIAMVLSSMLSIVWAVHSVKEKFYEIETWSIAANIISLLVFYFAITRYGIYAAAWVAVFRILLQLIFLGTVLGAYQKPDFKTPSFKITWKKLRPLLAGNLYYKTDTVVDRHLSSITVNGDLTLFNLAQQIYASGYSLLSKVLISTMVPQMAKAHGTGNHSEYNSVYKKRLFTSLIITFAVFAGLLIFGKPVLTFIFSFKNFDTAYVSKLWWIMVLLGGYWVFGLMGAVTSSTFYAKGNTVTPTKVGAIMFTIFIPLKIIAYYRYGILGLAIVISIYYVSSFLVQFILLRKHLK